MYANCQRFGFIVRYLKGYEDVTGYSFEPWHIRYVGPEHAEAIAASGLPLKRIFPAGSWNFMIICFIML